MASRVTSYPNPTADLAGLIGRLLVAHSPNTRARHRAAGPVRTPLHDIADSISANAAPIGRGAVITALSTGMLATAAIPAVSASEDNLAGVDVSSLTGNASAALAQEPISVPADAEVSFSSIEVTAVAPVAAPTERRTPVATTSRTENRTEQPSTSSSESSSRSAETETKSAPANPDSNSIVEIASQYVGTPYVHGGKSPGG